MAIDLHLHSRVSDGTDEPEEIIRRSAERGLSAVALTDHDTLDGIPRAMAEADRLGVHLIPGVELSVDWPTGTMHMLVYHLEPGPGPLQDRLSALVDARTHRNEKILERLADMGIAISHDAVVAEAHGGVVGRPHIAALLVAGGHALDIRDAFDRYLARGRPGYVDRVRLGAIEAIELARASGGAPVIAHPHTLGLTRDEFADAFEELAATGLAGIESWYSEYDHELRAHLAGLADRLGLIATGGSDYHGAYKPNLEVGIGTGDLVVPDHIVDDLTRAATQR